MKKFSVIAVGVLMLLSAFAFFGCENQGPGENEEDGLEAWRNVQYELAEDDRYADKVITEATFEVDKNIKDTSSEVLSFDPVFNDGMVLQQGTVNVICGKTEAENIAVMYKSRLYYGTVENGEWMVYLPIMNASKTPYRLTAYTELGKKSLSNVYVGEVFICAGQSNMDITLAQFAQMGNLEGRPTNTHQDDINNAHDDLLRLFLVDNSVKSFTPVDEYGSTAMWQGASPSTVGSFSAVGYLFGRRMREALDVPVGLIDTAVGGTGIVFWLTNEGYAELKESGVHMYADARDPDSEDVAQTPLNAAVVPGYGYNAIIHPLRHLKVRGTVWYQGETDAMGGVSAESYEKTLHRLAADWRETFDCPNMTWTIVELPRWDGAGLMSPVNYGVIREAQQNFAKNDKLGAMSVSIDLGEWTADNENDSIHPNDKSEISLRLANETLYRFFGKNVARSPYIESVEQVADNKVQIKYANVGSGLIIKNLAKGFEITSDGGITYSDASEITATVAEDGCTVLVEASFSFNGLRYGYNPSVRYEEMKDVSKQVTIFNSMGMPADQFSFLFE